MAKGNLQDYELIKATDIFEFWAVYDLWLNKLKHDTKNAKNGRRI